ncbi:MAG: Eco57I restriction-modification methylase domain-containing protein [Paludibacter sp.]|nr:Eco57I restriction-modification methylase domain-containing protein [Paludibacter sp.]
MSLFQIQVERQYIAGITTNLSPIYEKYLAYFGNQDIQANILQVKEEQYQGEFIRALFVDILGYTAQPHLNYNLLREKKNETDAKSADAAIIVNNKIVAVIELKDHKTQDLKKIEPQAFGYKNNHSNCRYVVTSNFERLRFYIENAVEFIEFDLFNLTYDDFKRLWLCLSYESILKDLPLEVKKESVSNEDIITKKLYKDYSVFKRSLFDNIVLLNPEYDKLLLFKKTQKLLDRFLFLFFAEDKELLPANSVKSTVEKWGRYNSDPMNDYRTLYSRFVRYFKLLDEGYKDANVEIYAYNGGLFANDEILNSIRIDDAILSENILKLTIYDFGTEVDVNILGHIFENSLNEIEEVTNEITTGVKTTSRRRQEGVFYTPRYITQYIVENTVGRLCEEKKVELGIGEELFEYKRADKKKQALKVFDKYRDWLLQITIVDPACGSGAFLNTALDFLIAEHAWIDSQQEKITGLKGHYSMELSNIENTILENNLFGVDINEESVEIARLSLWLRTAKPHRKLSSLNDNIKCGNSLINDPTVAGEKAFDWYKEFPQVFGRKGKTEEVIIIEKNETPDYLKLIKEKSLEAQAKAEQGIELSKEALEITRKLTEYVDKLESVSAPKEDYEKQSSGFDVVIGNPPYVRLETMKDLSESMSKMNYKTFEKRGDLYCLFVEKGFDILKKNGVISFIMPNKWLQAGYGKSLREYFLSYELNQLIDFGDIQIFEGATTYPCIFVSRKAKPKEEFTVSVLPEAGKEDFYSNVVSSAETFKTNQFSGDTWVISSWKEKKLIESLNNKFSSLFEFISGEAFYGMKTGLTEAFLIDETIREQLIKEHSGAKDIIKPVLRGRDINKWVSIESNSYIIGTFPALNIDIENYPSIKNYLLSFGKKRLEQSGEKGSRKKANNKWFETQDTFAYWKEFSKPKIMYQKFQVKPCFIYDEQGLYCNDSMWIIPSENKGLLAILNSKLGWWLITKYCTQIQNGVQLIWKYFGQIPIANTTDELAVKANEMLSLNTELHEVSQKFQRMLQRKFELEDLPIKLQNWYTLSYKEFIAELGKKKVKLTLAQEAEWEEYFNAEQVKAMQVKNQIEETDKEIDIMVYKLYGLTEEEVGIVEGKK